MLYRIMCDMQLYGYSVTICYRVIVWLQCYHAVLGGMCMVELLCA